MSVIESPTGAERPLALPDGAQVGAAGLGPGRAAVRLHRRSPGRHRRVGRRRRDRRGQPGAGADRPGRARRRHLGQAATVRWSRDGRSLLVLAAPDGAARPAGAADRAADRGDRGEAVPAGDLPGSAADTRRRGRASRRWRPRSPVPGKPGHRRSAPNSVHPGSTRAPEDSPGRDPPAGAPAAAAVLVPRPMGAVRPPDRGLGSRRDPLSPSSPICRSAMRCHARACRPVRASSAGRSGHRPAWSGLEALDGGDPVTPAEHRDRLFRLAAPFDRRTGARDSTCGTAASAGTTWTRRGQVLLAEHDRDRRWLTTWLVRPGRHRRGCRVDLRPVRGRRLR